MMHRSLTAVRLAAGLLVAVVVAVATACAITDSSALPVGAVFLALIVASGLAGLYRYADIGALLLGGVAYAILEQSRGSEGVRAWVAAVGGFIVAVAAVRFLTARIRAAELRIRQTHEVADELSIYDPASGLLKPRYGELAIEEEINRARRTNTALTLVLLAADPVPDHGLEAPPNEEEEARLMGAVLRASLRSTDRSARLGPTQFAAILPATDAEGGAAVADKLFVSSEQEAGRPRRCAVATFPDHAVSAQDLLAEAQAALRLARAAGLATVTPTMLHGLGVAT